MFVRSRANAYAQLGKHYAQLGKDCATHRWRQLCWGTHFDELERDSNFASGSLRDLGITL